MFSPRSWLTRQARADTSVGWPAVERSINGEGETPTPASETRACCCPAGPRVRVFVPLQANGESTGRVVDILLCGHHYRACADRLSELGAVPVSLMTGVRAEECLLV